MAPSEVAPLAREYLDAGGASLKVRARMSVRTPSNDPTAFQGFSTLVGPPAYLAEQIAAYAELGAAYVSVVPGFDEETCADTIEALGQALTLLA